MRASSQEGAFQVVYNSISQGLCLSVTIMAFLQVPGGNQGKRQYLYYFGSLFDSRNQQFHGKIPYQTLKMLLDILFGGGRTLSLK